MAEVFSGHSIGDHGFQKPVAIKRLLPELANDDVFVDRLIEEAKLLVGVQHGNIVSVLDLARDGDDVFLVMEYVDGPSLRQLLKSRGRRGVSLAIATYVVQSAAAGLAFAHNRPDGAIIHADISPSNILLSTSGEVRVADFGIARRENSGHGVVEGKWAYMAPEQARGEPLTPRSDVFALGVVLYELICGAHPFGRQVTAEERDSAPLRVIPPRVVRPTVPAGIDAICMRALAHDPRDRYRGMQQLIDALVEERFTNQWREGASDLAHAIRECNPQAAVAPSRTMVTDRPVTIATSSLIRELTPVRRSRRSQSDLSRSMSLVSQLSEAGSISEYSASASASASMSLDPSSIEPLTRAPRATPAPPSMVPGTDSGARTTAFLTDEVMKAAAMMELPPLLRADGTPMPPFKLSEALAPGQDLNSVVGGHTAHSHHVGLVVPEARNTKWTIIVLFLAAVIGVVAAVMIAHDSSVPVPTPDLGTTTATPPPTVDPIEQAPVAASDRQSAPAIDSTSPDSDSPDSAATEAATDTDTKATDSATDATDTQATDTQATDTQTTDTQATAAKAQIRKPAVIRRRPVRKPVGYLRVQSAPWSEVYVNGQHHPTPGARFELRPGKYRVVLKNGQQPFNTIVKWVTIESNRTSSLSVNMLEDF